jgi:hypothetical protein
MSMNRSNTVEAHVSSTPLVICVGDESRMWEFEENGFPAFVYKQLRVELKYPGAPNYGGPLSPLLMTLTLGPISSTRGSTSSG